MLQSRPLTGARMLEVRNVGFRFGHQQVLSGVSLSLGASEVVGLVAPNGAGKTTLMRVISGIHLPDEGDVRVDGHSIAALSKRDFHRRLFFADIGHCVLPALTTREHLEYVKDAWSSEISIDPVVEVLGISWFLDKRMGALSLGMAQLAVIAMSIVSDASYLILDEPMNGLDPTNTAEVTRQLRGLVARGKSVFISSHLLSHLDELADRVLFLRDGTIACERRSDGGPTTAEMYGRVFGGL